jgi:hypothetical protein
MIVVNQSQKFQSISPTNHPVLPSHSQLMEAHSGHYRPSPENFEALVQRLVRSGADLHLAKVTFVPIGRLSYTLSSLVVQSSCTVVV